MQRRPPLDAIDSRTIFVIYASVVGAAGVFITLWGSLWVSLWVGGPLNGQPWGVHSLTRMVGVVAVGAACCAAAFARIEDPSNRREALAWFLVAHSIVLLMATVQTFSVWGHALPPPLFLALYVYASVCVFLFIGWSRHGGDIAPWRVYMGIFGKRAPSPTELLRSQHEQQMRQAGAQEERHRLARDLHDSVKQQIFAIQTAAATAETRFSSDPDGARSALAQVRDAARDSMAEMDAMLDQLQVTPLENAGLAEALRQQCQALALRTGASVSCEVEALPPSGALPPGMHLGLFRAAQEALSNVARHARASNVRLTLGVADGKLELKVVDDGAGYADERVTTGMGLRNMQARASEFGGEARIISRPGAGTTVSVTIPYVGDEPRPFLKKALWSAAAVIALFVAAISDVRRPGMFVLLLVIGAIDLGRYIAAWRRARRLRMTAT